MTTEDDYRFLDIWVEEDINSCPATAKMSETDRSIWLFLMDGGIDDGINDEVWVNRLVKGLYVLSRIECGDWEVYDKTSGVAVDHHQQWLADDGPRGKDI